MKAPLAAGLYQWPHEGLGGVGGPLSLNYQRREAIPKTKQRECGPFPPSLGARPALRLPPVPTGMW